VYEEQTEEHQNFMVSDGPRLIELATCDVELVEEEQGPPKKRLQKSQHIIEGKQRCEQLNTRVTEADSDVDDF
jgi:hypothetical protein